MPQKPELLTSAIQDALQLLQEGVRLNNAEMIDSALSAIPGLMHECIDASRFELISLIGTEMKSLFAIEHSIIKKAANKRLSLDALEQILQFTTPTPAPLIWNSELPSKMSSRMAEMLAANFIRFQASQLHDTSQIRLKFASKKHKAAHDMLFRHEAEMVLDLPDADYKKYMMSQGSILLEVYQFSKEIDKRTLIMEAYVEHKDLVLALAARHRKTFGENSHPFMLVVIHDLYLMGFEELPGACMPALVENVRDDRHYFLLEKMGISPDLQRFEDAMVGDGLTIVSPHALAYVLESEHFSLEDLGRIYQKVQASDLSAKLLKSLAYATQKALGAIYRCEENANNPLIEEKSLQLLKWVLSRKPSEHADLRKELVDLPYIPERLLHLHPTMCDAKFGQDLGL